MDKEDSNIQIPPKNKAKDQLNGDKKIHAINSCAPCLPSGIQLAK